MVRLADWVTALGGQANAMTDVQSRQHFIRGRAAGQPMLAVVDDVWSTSIDAARHLLDALPAGLPRLVTTRNREVAGALGCTIYRLDFMAGDQALDLIQELVGPLDAHREAAERIILCCAGRSHEEAELRAREDGWLHEVGVLPLAVRLAAGLADAPADLPGIADDLRTQPILAQLAREGSDAPGGDHRQDSVERSFSMSYERLPDDATRRCFRRLGAFAPAPAPFRLEEAAGVWEMEVPAARQTMRCLVRRSLAQKEGDSYRLHGLVAQYAALLLEDAGETDTARGRHAEMYRAVAAQLKDEDWAFAEEAMPQFRHGFAHAIAQENGELADAYLAAVQHIMINRGLWGQHLQWQEAALDLARAAGDDASVASHLYMLAWTIEDRGDLDRALSFYEESLTLRGKLGDRSGRSRVLHNMAYIYTVRGDLDRALALYEESLQIKEALGDRQGKIRLPPRDGLHLPSARRPRPRAGSLRRVAPDQGGPGRSAGQVRLPPRDGLHLHRARRPRPRAGSLRRVAPDQGGPGRSGEGKSASLGTRWPYIYRVRRRPRPRAGSLRRVAPDQGGPGRSAGQVRLPPRDGLHLHRARRPRPRAGSLRRVAPDTRGPGRSAGQVRLPPRDGLHLPSARRPRPRAGSLRRVAPDLEALGDRQGKSASLHAMAYIYTVRGDLDRALALYEESLQIKEALGDRKGKSASLHEMAYIYRVRGDLDRALALYEESLPDQGGPGRSARKGDEPGNECALVCPAPRT